MLKCDFCGRDAKYDGKTKLGPWAYMCQKCFDVNGCHVKGLYTELKESEPMSEEQIEWCSTLDGNCFQCKFNNTCDMCKL